MKKSIVLAFTIFVSAIVMSNPLFSATEGDLVGVWNTYSVTKLKISHIGSTASDNSSTTTLLGDGTFTLHEFDSTGIYDYTGNWELIKDGKKMLVGLDENGRSELIRMLENWMMEMAEENGVTVSDISISIVSLTISQPGIPKRTNIPRKTVIKAKGLVSAILEGESLIRKFSYISKVSFLNKQ